MYREAIYVAYQAHTKQTPAAFQLTGARPHTQGGLTHDDSGVLSATYSDRLR